MLTHGLLAITFLIAAQVPTPPPFVDVCCYMGKSDEKGIDLRADFRSSEDCRFGKKIDGYGVCGFKVNDENCPSTETKEICKRCNYHWTDQYCLPEDPVKQAEEFLKMKAESEAKKEKQAQDKLKEMEELRKKSQTPKKKEPKK